MICQCHAPGGGWPIQGYWQGLLWPGWGYLSRLCPPPQGLLTINLHKLTRIYWHLYWDTCTACTDIKAPLHYFGYQKQKYCAVLWKISNNWGTLFCFYPIDKSKNKKISSLLCFRKRWGRSNQEIKNKKYKIKKALPPHHLKNMRTINI